jgi:hypothetical protein
MAGGKEFGRVEGPFLHRGRRKLNAYVESPLQYRCQEYSRTEEASAAALGVNPPKALSHQKGDIPWITLGKRRCDIPASETYALESIEATIMNVRSRGFGQI